MCLSDIDYRVIQDKCFLLVFLAFALLDENNDIFVAIDATKVVG
jgi:hypothetical protein